VSLCTCDPEKDYDLECFVHGSSNRQRLRIVDLEKKLAVAVEAFGQLKSMVDDCQHMSRFAANKFDEIIDKALSKIQR
jgi:hypothetical protein